MCMMVRVTRWGLVRFLVPVDKVADPVSSAVWHPQAVVLATCSGRRIINQEYDSDSDDSIASDASPKDSDKTRAPDNTLKIWSV